MIQNTEIKIIQEAKYEQGRMIEAEHSSSVCNCPMKFSIYLPYIQQQTGKKYPLLYILAGLGSDHLRFPHRSGFGRHAKKHNFIVVFPDTSPRKTNIEGIDECEEYGDSAGFYVNASTDKYKNHFRMFTYVTQELPSLIQKHYPINDEKPSIIGWSMGGLGALLCGFKTNKYCCISALGPVSNPIKGTLYGVKSYEQYFSTEEQKKEWDPVELLLSKKAEKIPLFIDYGSDDEYHQKSLRVRQLSKQLQKMGYQHIHKEREGYNHSMYFVQTFLGEHFEFHSVYHKKGGQE